MVHLPSFERNDNWNGTPLERHWPHLFSFAINKDATIMQVLQGDTLESGHVVPASSLD